MSNPSRLTVTKCVIGVDGSKFATRIGCDVQNNESFRIILLDSHSSSLHLLEHTMRSTAFLVALASVVCTSNACPYMGGAYAYGQNPHMMAKNPHGIHRSNPHHQPKEDSAGQTTEDVFFSTAERNSSRAIV